MKNILLSKIGKISVPVLFFIALVSFIGKNADKTVTGEILDMKCFMTNGDRGEGHKDCAAMCIKGGQPMGIIDADNKVYLLLEGKNAAAFEEAKKHAGETITATGALSEKSGVQALIVSEVKAKK